MIMYLLYFIVGIILIITILIVYFKVPGYVIAGVIVLMFVYLIFITCVYDKVPTDSELSKSLLGNKYQTTSPVALNYSMYDKNFHLTEWRNEPYLGNPKKWDCYVKIIQPIKFEIIDVRSMPIVLCIDSGPSLDVRIKLLDDINFSDIEDYLEADFEDDKLYEKYVYKDFAENDNPYISERMDPFNQKLLTKDFVIKLSAWTFFNLTSKDIFNMTAITHKNSLEKL